jgi:tetratricopeptide (TPR) repeat protein
MKTTRFAVILILLFWTGCTALRAEPNQESPESLFARANSEYQKRNYAAASEAYARILKMGVESGPLYYNCGNACFRQKKLGEAIYYWEKALQLSPADQETRDNLEFANSLTVDRQASADSLPARLLGGFLNFLTVTQAGWAALSLFFACNILFAIFLLMNGRLASRALIGSLLAGILFIASAGALAWKTYDRDFRTKAIVVEEKADVRSGPGLENMTVFPVHEGLKVRVHRATEGWFQISLPNGWTGWIPQQAIRML